MLVKAVLKHTHSKRFAQSKVLVLAPSNHG